VFKKLKKIKKFPSLVTAAAYLALRLYSLLVFKRKGKNYEYAKKENFPLVALTWHNRLLFFPIVFKRDLRENTAAMISASRDGEYLSDLIGFFGVAAIRGSSSKKGMRAIQDSIRTIESGKSVCITPDGPRGPCYKMSNGPVIIASKTGAPVVALSINYSNFWELPSWDKFRIPKPFSKVTVALGDPIQIPPNLSDEEIEKWRLLLEEKLNEIS
jgi:lysophospholipid acyltransferase (LPLAT)-like uncharacterized protein